MALTGARAAVAAMYPKAAQMLFPHPMYLDEAALVAKIAKMLGCVAGKRGGGAW
jgi:hypothetical protein